MNKCEAIYAITTTVAFFALITLAVYFTKTAFPLFALLFTPTFSSGDSDDD